MNKMKPEVKEKWVNALRSGEYKQGDTALRKKHNNTFCCLGVLCDLAERAGIVRSFVGGDGTTMFYQSVGTDEREPAVLPAAVVDWAGIEHESPYLNCKGVKKVDGTGIMQPMTELNDFFNLTFEEIADLIEAQL